MSLADQLRLMVLTDPVLLKGRDAVDVCRRAAGAGATMFQVRWKDGDAAAIVELTRSLVAALQVPVIVNDRVDVALAAGAAGAHLGWDDLPLDAARKIAPSRFILGISVGSSDEAQRALRQPADYWSIGPCFSTATKSDAGQALGTDGFGRLARLAPSGMPVIGVGGITAATAGALRRAGASGVAVTAAVLGATDPAAATAALWAVSRE